MWHRYGRSVFYDSLYSTCISTLIFFVFFVSALPKHQHLSFLGLSKRCVVIMDDDSVIESLAQQGVVESNLDDLKDLVNEIETTDVYSLNKDSLNKWAFKLRNISDLLDKHALFLKKNSAHMQQSPLNANAPQPPSVPTHKQSTLGGGGGGASSKRRESIRPKSEGLSTLEGPVPSSLSAHVASTLHMLTDTLCHIVHSEWAVCYIYQEATRKLVMIGGAGKRQGRPGDIKLHAGIGIESLVLENGVAVCMALAAAETEFSDEQDKVFGDHSKSMLIFPVFKPGSTTATVGVLEVGNRLLGGPFTPDDEAAVSDCAFLIGHLISRYPSDLTNPNTLDASIFNKPKDSVERIVSNAAGRQTQMVYRTGHHGQPRKAEVLRDAVVLPRNPTIENVLDHVAHVSEAWKSAVMLNIELEHEIRRLHEALRISRRETARLQDVANVKS